MYDNQTHQGINRLSYFAVLDFGDSFPFRKFYGRHHDLVNRYEYLCHKWPRICSVCGSYNPIFSLLTTYHGVCNKCNTTGATSVAGSVHPSEAPEFTPVLFECSW